MRKITLAISALVLLSASPAYAGSGGNIIGTLLGGALGGLLGNQIGHGQGRIAATVGGAIIGGIIGGHYGSEIDQEDRYYGSGAAYWSVNSNMFSDQVPASQYVPNYVAQDAPAPQSFGTYNVAMEAYCRPFSQDVMMGNRIVHTYVTACQLPDGSWQVMQ